MAKTAQVHRFHDCVAVHVGNGETVYLDPVDAWKLAKTLRIACYDIRDKTFANSRFASVELELAPTRHDRR